MGVPNIACFLYLLSCTHLDARNFSQLGSFCTLRHVRWGPAVALCRWDSSPVGIVGLLVCVVRSVCPVFIRWICCVAMFNWLRCIIGIPSVVCVFQCGFANVTVMWPFCCFQAWMIAWCILAGCCMATLLMYDMIAFWYWLFHQRMVLSATEFLWHWQRMTMSCNSGCAMALISRVGCWPCSGSCSTTCGPANAVVTLADHILLIRSSG